MKKFLTLSLLIFITAIYYKFYYQMDNNADVNTRNVPDITSTTQRSSKQVVQEKTFSTNENQKRVIRPKISDQKPKPIERPIRRSKVDDEYTYKQISKDEVLVQNVILTEEFITVQEDIILDHIDQLDKYKKGEKILKIARPKIWQDNIVPYVFSDDLPESIKEKFKDVLQTHDETVFKKVKFKPRKDEQNYVEIKFIKEKCYSNLGQIGGKQTLALSEQCREKEILHEIFHSLGVIHEQSRKDRDEFVQIIWENIEEKFWPQFYKFPWEQYDHKEYGFDSQSIMMYDAYAFAVNPGESTIISLFGDPIQPSQLPTELDLKKLNQLYQ